MNSEVHESSWNNILIKSCSSFHNDSALPDGKLE